MSIRLYADIYVQRRVVLLSNDICNSVIHVTYLHTYRIMFVLFDVKCPDIQSNIQEPDFLI